MGEREATHFIPVTIAAPVGSGAILINQHHEHHPESFRHATLFDCEVPGFEIALPVGSPDFSKCVFAIFYLEQIMLEGREVGASVALVRCA